jgi:hypothetical protein
MISSTPTRPGLVLRRCPLALWRAIARVSSRASHRERETKRETERETGYSGSGSAPASKKIEYPQLVHAA